MNASIILEGTLQARAKWTYRFGDILIIHRPVNTHNYIVNTAKMRENELSLEAMKIAL